MSASDRPGRNGSPAAPNVCEYRIGDGRISLVNVRDGGAGNAQAPVVGRQKFQSARALGGWLVGEKPDHSAVPAGRCPDDPVILAWRTRPGCFG